MAIMQVDVSHRTVSAHRPGTLVDYLGRDGRHVGMADLVAQGQHLPDWATGNPGRFFEVAAAAERVNGRWATQWIIALPRELDHAQRVELTEAFLAAQLPDKGYYWVMHNHVARDGGEQPHLHILWNERSIDGEQRGHPKDCFRRYNPRHPAKGGWQKDPFWQSPRALYALRAGWAECVNYCLEQAGHQARIYPGRIPDRQTRHDPEKLRKAQAAARAWWEGQKAHYGVLPGTVGDFAMTSTTRTREESLAYQRMPRRGTAMPQESQQSIQRLERTIRLLTARLSTVNRQEPRPSRQGLEVDLYANDATYAHPHSFHR